MDPVALSVAREEGALEASAKPEDALPAGSDDALEIVRDVDAAADAAAPALEVEGMELGVTAKVPVQPATVGIFVMLNGAHICCTKVMMAAALSSIPCPRHSSAVLYLVPAWSVELHDCETQHVNSDIQDEEAHIHATSI
jgi:hypothetical protein